MAPAPETLQQTGCVISMGGTTTNQFTGSLITQPDDLTPLLTPSVNVSSATWASGLMTIATTTAHGIPTGQTMAIDWAGTNIPALNSTWWMTASDSHTLTFELSSNPGSVTTDGTVTNHSVAQIQAYITTHFSMGFNTAIYVLEVGANGDNSAIAALASYLNLFPNYNYRPGRTGYYYIYAVPKSWDANTNFLTLARQYDNPSARTYFATTVHLNNISGVYQDTDKSILTMIEAVQLSARPNSVTVTSAAWANGALTYTVPSGNLVQQGDWFDVVGATPTALNGWHKAKFVGDTWIQIDMTSNPGSITGAGTILANYFAANGAPETEFSIAAMVWCILTNNPSDTNKVLPLQYQYLYGVTAFASKGVGALLDTLYANGYNIVGDGSEGGIANTVVNWGKTRDQKQFNYWYATDWCVINADIMLSNAVINGSNDPINPLYYNQDGINRLEAVLASVFARAVTFGLVLYKPIQLGLVSADLSAGLEAQKWTQYTIINAIPFFPYVQNNPSDYPAGVYKGFSAIFVPQLGFEQLQMNFLVSEFPGSTTAV